MASQHKIWFDGQLLPWKEASVHVTTHALHYGSSVFEGIRAYGTPKGLAVLGLQQHTRRFFQSAKIFQMALAYTPEEMNAAILETLRVNNHTSAYIRPLAIRGEGLGTYGLNFAVHLIIITLEWTSLFNQKTIEQGIDVMVSSWRRMAPDTHPALGKIGGNYVNSQFIVMEARARGFAEAIVLDVHGQVSEGATQNFFLILDDVVYTPPIASSILAGITRRFVMQLLASQGYELREQAMPREMLYIADEIFLTGTASEIVPVRSVDGYTIGCGTCGPITQQLQSDFFAIVRGHADDRHGWLTYVQ